MRTFRIQRFDDFDCVRFMLIYPENLSPGERGFQKEVVFSSLGLTVEKWKVGIEEALSNAKADFDKELTELGI